MLSTHSTQDGCLAAVRCLAGGLCGTEATPACSDPSLPACCWCRSARQGCVCSALFPKLTDKQEASSVCLPNKANSTNLCRAPTRPRAVSRNQQRSAGHHTRRLSLQHCQHRPLPSELLKLRPERLPAVWHRESLQPNVLLHRAEGAHRGHQPQSLGAAPIQAPPLMAPRFFTGEMHPQRPTAEAMAAAPQLAAKGLRGGGGASAAVVPS